MSRTGEAERGSEPVALHDLFIGFLKLSLGSFGGGLIWARRLVVDQRRWMNEQEFAETLTLCQLMPGPNIVGITVCVGAKLRCGIGAITAVAGFILLPLTAGLSLGGMVLRYAHLAVVESVLGGLSAAAAGLLIGTGLRLLMPYRRPLALLFAGLALPPWYLPRCRCLPSCSAWHLSRLAPPPWREQEHDERRFPSCCPGSAPRSSVVDQLWRVPHGSP
jgi:chromate transporter